MKASDKMIREGDRERALLLEASALGLRANGFSFDDIADRLNIPRDKAALAVRRGLKRHKAECLESIKQIAEMENYRLDQLFFAAYTHVTRGDLQGIAMAIKVMERRAKLLGLDAPAKQAVELTSRPDYSAVPLETLKEIEAALSGVGTVSEDETDLGFDY